MRNRRADKSRKWTGGQLSAEEKARFSALNAILREALSRIAQFVIRLAPVGVFALVASTAGTISFAQLADLRVYIFIYIALALLLSLWLLVWA